MASQESLAVRKMLMEQKRVLAEHRPSLAEMRAGLETLMSGVPLESDVRVEKVTVDGIPGEWVAAPGAIDGAVFLYLHGGGYCMGSCNTHRDLAARISRACRTRMLVIEYRLAPEHPFPAQIEDAVAAYRWLVASGVAPDRVIIGGDSAGGGLTVATLLTLRDAQDSLPAAAVLLSPWTDMEGKGDSMVTRAEDDPWLNPEGIRAMASVYTRGIDPRHPLVSPIYADLSGLPPMLVHVGRDECLLDDSTRLVERARASGVDVTFKVWDDMWHVFHCFAATVPEARQAIEEIGEFVKARLGL